MKYDYLKILSNFTEKQYKLFYTLTTNEDAVAHEIYKAVKASTPGCSEMFLQTGDKFIQWITFYSPKNESLSIFDTLLIGHIYRNSDWAEDYYGDESDLNGILAYLIASWKNKTKSLKANMNMLQMVYYRYIRFLNTDAGQDFAYAKSMDGFTDDDAFESGLYYEDRPYWESTFYKQQQLLKFKKNVLLKNCKTTLENLEMRVIWNLTFQCSGKFNIKEAERLVWEEIGKDAVSHTTLYKHLKRLRVVMLQEVYNHLDSDFDYFSDVSFELDGKITTFKNAIKSYLIDAKIDLAESRLNNVHTNIKIVDTARDWALKHGLQFSTSTGHADILAMVKGDSDGTPHKGWKTYFYKGGGYKDFYKGQTGFYVDLK